MDVKREHVVTLRFTSEELAAIDDQAGQEGRDRSGLIRWAIQQYLSTEKGNRDE